MTNQDWVKKVALKVATDTSFALASVTKIIDTLKKILIEEIVQIGQFRWDGFGAFWLQSARRAP